MLRHHNNGGTPLLPHRPVILLPIRVFHPRRRPKHLPQHPPQLLPVRIARRKNPRRPLQRNVRRPILPRHQQRALRIPPQVMQLGPLLRSSERHSLWIRPASDNAHLRRPVPPKSGQNSPPIFRRKLPPSLRQHNLPSPYYATGVTQLPAVSYLDNPPIGGSPLFNCVTSQLRNFYVFPLRYYHSSPYYVIPRRSPCPSRKAPHVIPSVAEESRRPPSKSPQKSKSLGHYPKPAAG